MKDTTTMHECWGGKLTSRMALEHATTSSEDAAPRGASVDVVRIGMCELAHSREIEKLHGKVFQYTGSTSSKGLTVKLRRLRVVVGCG